MQPASVAPEPKRTRALKRSAEQIKRLLWAARARREAALARVRAQREQAKIENEREIFGPLAGSSPATSTPAAGAAASELDGKSASSPLRPENRDSSPAPPPSSSPADAVAAATVAATAETATATGAAGAAKAKTKSPEELSQAVAVAVASAPSGTAVEGSGGGRRRRDRGDAGGNRPWKGFTLSDGRARVDAPS